MDTTKTSNPSSKADEADDLIEELARLMADDAQINTPSAQPVAQPGGFKPRGLSEEGGTPPPPAASTTPEAGTASQKSDLAPNSGGEPSFDLNQFDLGAPKAEISSVGTDTDTPATPVQETPVSKASEQAASAAGSSDFDFGFGIGPVGSETPQATGQPAADAPSGGEPEQSSDPIADLINAAVSKHDNAGPAGDPFAQTSPTPPASQAPPVAPQTTVEGNADASKDSFTSPPVFGVEGNPAPQTDDKSFGGSMALDEIESLIGNSVNVDTTSTQPDMSAQMAVEGPPLTPPPSNAPGMPTQAKIATLADDDTAPSGASASHPDSAEAAILQAMAAAGTATSAASATQAKAEIPAPLSAADDTENLAAEPMLASGRVAVPGKLKTPAFNYLMPLAGILVVGAIGLGAYFLLNPGQGDANVPVLVADGVSTRQAPPPAEPAPESVVLNQIDGNTTPVESESLVSRDDTDGATGPTIRQVITADNSEAGLANRRVRTVTVRPDGTIISGEDAVAGGQVLPVAEPVLPDLPANAVNTELSSTTVAALPQTPAIEVGVQTTPVTGTLGPVPRPRLSNRRELAERARTAQAQLPLSSGASTSGQASTVNLLSAPVPSSGGAIETVSIVNSAATAPVNSTTNVANPRAFVQLASQRSQDTANATARRLQAEHSAALNGGTLVVRSVDLGTRGIYYRVQLPTDTVASANSICNSIKSSGGDCFVRSN